MRNGRRGKKRMNKTVDMLNDVRYLRKKEQWLQEMKEAREKYPDLTARQYLALMNSIVHKDQIEARYRMIKKGYGMEGMVVKALGYNEETDE